MPAQKLKEFLDRNGIRYVSIRHSPAYTAPEIAAAAHIHGKQLAKTVIVKIDGKLAMTVLPANYHVNLEVLKKSLGAKSVELAGEKEFKDKFPGCEIGAMPPFGNLYGMDLYAEDALEENEEIVFNAGSHTELIRMSYKDFKRLAEPKVISFLA
jgi:Ala-tRNA(Pro) deacylase